MSYTASTGSFRHKLNCYGFLRWLQAADKNPELILASFYNQDAIILAIIISLSHQAAHHRQKRINENSISIEAK